MEYEAVGTFELTLEPINAGHSPVGTVSIAKIFHGDLRGASSGRMLSFRGAVPDSAGYVAMERVTATLANRDGAFTLQHSGLLDRGVQSLSVVVVPDSGAQGLLGIAGSMEITVSGGRHEYRFRYGFPG